MITDEERNTNTMERETAYFAGRHAGATDERERILELLRALRAQAQARKLNTNVNISEIIAMIKGMNK